MVVVTEVHPFEDGNGRVARVMMNAELSAVGAASIVIPSVYRNEHVAGRYLEFAPVQRCQPPERPR
ncbi:MAG: Fic family protein [Acidimicrobiaceae bacterium]|nr:Fic family protein [Acidimicrobiaceae bacterium]MXZ99958.1 Fic family protein [Acidimicrobiaceae bacterium]MYE74834.1 Fic family protein [Acidimicrobiaceae bacterium]MYE98522.1 Fic family protein [Acidimicrobiaceae bacterium]MYI54017.1 Fic family protein [Acidimicrobiaceae bacterium]